VLKFRERASDPDQARLQDMIVNWKPQFLAPTLHLLSKYDALAESAAIIHQYLKQARHFLEQLPPTADDGGLAGLTNYLARQTDALGSGA